MQIIQDFIPAGRRNRPGTKMVAKTTTIHNTGNGNADALCHAIYLKKNPGSIDSPKSWHFTVDPWRIVQHIPIDEQAYHAGDGKGPGNTSSIGIEICEVGDIEKAEENAAWLVAYLGLPPVQHYKWTKKNCPRIIRARPNGWVNFLNQVKGEYQMKAEDANKIIAAFLGPMYNFVTDPKEKAECKRLADELRKASGQM